MSLESIARITKNIFAHWTSVSLLTLAGATAAIPVTDNIFIEEYNNDHMFEEQVFLDEFNQNMEDITTLRKSMVVADKTKDLDEFENGKWDITSREWGDYTLTKMRGAEQLEQKTDDMIVGILTDTELSESTFYKISQEMKDTKLQTYNIDMSDMSSWYLREAQRDLLGSDQSNNMTAFEKAQGIRSDMKSETNWDMAALFLMFLIYGNTGGNMSIWTSKLAGIAEDKLKKNNQKKNRPDN